MKKILFIFCFVSLSIFVSCGKNTISEPIGKDSLPESSMLEDKIDTPSFPKDTHTSDTSVKNLVWEFGSFSLPDNFLVEGMVAKTPDFSESQNGTQVSGIKVAIVYENQVADSIADSKNAADFFYELTQNCSNCNLDAYAKIEQIGNTYFALYKNLITSEINEGGDIDKVWKSYVNYSASTAILQKEFKISLSYVQGEQNEKEMQELFESVLISFSK